MKKRISIFILLFISLFTLTACSSKNELSCTKKDSKTNEKTTIKVKLKGNKIVNYSIITAQKYKNKKSYNKACSVLQDYYNKQSVKDIINFKVDINCVRLTKNVVITKTYDVSKLKSVDQIELINIKNYTKNDFTFQKEKWLKNKKETDYKCK